MLLYAQSQFQSQCRANGMGGISTQCSIMATVIIVNKDVRLVAAVSPRGFGKQRGDAQIPVITESGASRLTGRRRRASPRDASRGEMNCSPGPITTARGMAILANSRRMVQIATRLVVSPVLMVIMALKVA